jgi:ferredoxin-NADP reductase
VAVRLYRTVWRLAEVIGVSGTTPMTRSLLLEVPGWEGHKAGQHVDVRLTAPTATKPRGATRSRRHRRRRGSSSW